MNSGGQYTTDSGRRRWTASLTELSEIAADTCGLDVRELRVGQIVLMRTQHTTYRAEITNPSSGAAIVSGDGAYLKTPTHAVLVGATLSGRGSSVATGQVLTGFRFVIASGHGEIITSRVRAISVDGMPWFTAFRPT